MGPKKELKIIWVQYRTEQDELRRVRFMLQPIRGFQGWHIRKPCKGWKTPPPPPSTWWNRRRVCIHDYITKGWRGRTVYCDLIASQREIKETLTAYFKEVYSAKDVEVTMQ